MTPQRFESKRQVVEAVQLTADADWEAIAKWCGGTVGVSDGAPCAIALGQLPAAPVAYEDEWIVLSEGKRYILTDEDFRDEFQPVPVREGVACEIRQALEGTTPGPWKWVEDGESMWLENGDGTDVIRADQYEWLHMTQADGELIAAAPDLLARAADRIEELEQIWLRDLAAEFQERFQPAADIIEQLEAVKAWLCALVREMGLSFEWYEGRCPACDAYVDAHPGYDHEPSCGIAAAIDIAKEGA